MRRPLIRTFLIIAALWLIVAPTGGPSVEQLFVAQTQAAADAEMVCLMPPEHMEASAIALPSSHHASTLDRPSGRAVATASGPSQDRLRIPTVSENVAGDLPPARMVVDPYPSFNGVAVDPVNGLVMMSDTNRKSLLVYNQTNGSRSREVTAPIQQISGPETGIGFVAGVAMDPEHRELFTVNNDVEDRLVVFDYGARGNIKPKRLLYVPHQSWGIALNKKRGEIALSVQTPNMYVVFARDAQKFDAPRRSVRGPKTAMADPHGIYFDETHDEVFVANHGNFRPGELITSYTAYDARDARQERGANVLREGARGSFLDPSITVYDGNASGDVPPRRMITGNRTQLDWPMGVVVDEARDELIVANNGGNSVLVFPRSATGNVPPTRAIRGPLTGIRGPMGVTVANDEIWVANFGDHTALVFPRLAAGNVAPRRIIRNAPAGKETSGFGNPYAVAYDTKREQVLVPN